MGVQQLGNLIRMFVEGRVISDISLLRGKVIAIDALPAIYQMLAVIRDERGFFLRDSRGRITSHLVGLFNRTVRLLEEGVIPVFVFDGPPHPLRRKTLAQRREERERWWSEFVRAVEEGRRDEAVKLGKRAMIATREIVQSARRLLELMGAPVIQAPHDAEAQCAYIVKQGDAWCAATRDWDAFLFGCPRVLMHFKLSVSPSDWPKPRLYELEEFVRRSGITREMLVEIAILLGTDLNPGGVKGVGIKTALHLVRSFGTVERMIRAGRVKWIWEDVTPEQIRRYFLEPPVLTRYDLRWREPDEDALIEFLVEEHDFNRERVLRRLTALKRALRNLSRQSSLENFLEI